MQNIHSLGSVRSNLPEFTQLFADKYKAILRRQGIDAALNSFLKDSGLEENALVLRENNFSSKDRRGRVVGLIPNVQIAFHVGGSLTKVGAPYGYGASDKEAKRALFHQLIARGQNKPELLEIAGTDNAFLVISSPENPQTLIKVASPTPRKKRRAKYPEPS